MRSVLIIGPNYYNFLPAVAEAFRTVGWKTAVEGYDMPVHPYSGLMRVRYKLRRDRQRMQQESRAAYRAYIEERFDTVRPDFVFVLNGDMLESATLDHFCSKAQVALWMFDSRTRLPMAVGHVDHVDTLFCFEQADVRWYQAQGKQAFFLPQACDTAKYYPIEGCRKDIDILFVGNLFYSPRRKQLMNAVIDRFPDRRIVVYGWYQPWFKGIGAWLRRPHKEIFKNVNVSSEQANVLYNRARVVLNIHQEHQQDGANPRVFEICGAGAWQVCDRNPYIASLFPDGELGLYGDEQELFARIAEGLSCDRSEAAHRACELVRTEHSFEKRMAEVVRTVYGSSR